MEEHFISGTRGSGLGLEAEGSRAFSVCILLLRHSWPRPPGEEASLRSGNKANVFPQRGIVLQIPNQ